jgi:hypothetical protein
MWQGRLAVQRSVHSVTATAIDFERRGIPVRGPALLLRENEFSFASGDVSGYDREVSVRG